MTPRSGRRRAALAGAVLAACCSLAGAGRATADPARPWESFSGTIALRADSILCSEAFAGRKSGTRGGRAAEDWIARQLRLAGLRPAFDRGRYLQPFPVIGRQATDAELTLFDSPFGTIRFIASEDFQVMLTPAAGKVEAEAVFVGYGICAPEKGRDDYAGIDLRDKVAIILRGRPSAPDPDNWNREFARTHTFRAAVEHGARAVLYCQDDRPVAGAAIVPESYNPRVPAMFISKRVLGLILRGSGRRVADLETSLPDTSVSFATGRRLRVKIHAKGATVDTARNVAAILEGSDPDLAGEVVLIGAHHDHIGHDTHGLLYAGANDNGSGTSVVIEMARAAMAAGWRPRRTVCFATFAAEEMGLLGSKHFAAHMPFDSTRLVAMINMDMVGHGDGGTGVAGGDRLGPLYRTWLAGLDSTAAARVTSHELGGEHSDYAPFAKKGIRAVACWSRGEHRFYHDFEDQPGGVRADVLESVGQRVMSLLDAIADHPLPLRDGMGHERNLRAESLQIGFTPFDASLLASASVDALTGEGRIDGRIVRCDQGGRVSSDEVLRRLGRITAIGARKPSLPVAASLAEVKEGAGDLRTSLLPVVGVDLLESLGPDAVRPLRAAGMAGAYVGDGGRMPAGDVRRALAEAGCFVLCDGSFAWSQVVPSPATWVPGPGEAPEADAGGGKPERLLVRIGRAQSTLPDPPDTTLAKGIKALLVLSVEQPADSAKIRQAVAAWGRQRVHLDIAAGLESGINDRASLRFLSFLRGSVNDEAGLKALLGGNLATF